MRILIHEKGGVENILMYMDLQSLTDCYDVASWSITTEFTAQ